MAETDMQSPDPAAKRSPLDRWTGPMMFWLSFAYLALLAGLLCSHGITEYTWTRIQSAGQAVSGGNEDAPADSAPADLESVPGAELLLNGDENGFAVYSLLLELLIPLFFIEWLAHAIARRRLDLRRLIYCFVPPLRMGARDHVDGGAIWLPRLHWVRVDRELFSRMESAFSIPMLLIALMVLPLLGLEHYVASTATEPSWYMVIFMKLSESVIWLAFTLEFIIMVSVTPRRFRYCKEHWIDIAIIFLPLIGFLRILRIGRVLRLHRMAKIGRVYRVRGVTSRMFRGVLVLDIVRQLIEGNPERKLSNLREDLLEREEEIKQMRAEIQELERFLAEREQDQAEAREDSTGT